MSNVQRASIGQVVNEVFSRLDRSRNGVIERQAPGQQNEARLGMGDRLLLSTARAAGLDIPNFDPGAIARAADADNDSRVTRAEVTAFVGRLDANHDRFVDRAELSAGLAALRAGRIG